MPYNPLIAGAFFRSGQIEAWGRGIKKIADACKSWGKLEPFFRIRVNEVMIGFNTDVSIVENIVENIVETGGINETQRTIMALMDGNPKITVRLLAKEVGIASRNVQVHIQTLKAKGLVERVGPAKGGYWVVK